MERSPYEQKINKKNIKHSFGGILKWLISQKLWMKLNQ